MCHAHNSQFACLSSNQQMRAPRSWPGLSTASSTVSSHPKRHNSSRHARSAVAIVLTKAAAVVELIHAG